VNTSKLIRRRVYGAAAHTLEGWPDQTDIQEQSANLRSGNQRGARPWELAPADGRNRGLIEELAAQILHVGHEAPDSLRIHGV